MSRLRAASGAGLLSVVLVAGCEVSEPLHPVDVEVLAECNLGPNYLADVAGDLRRWASFPLTVSISVDPSVVGAGNVAIYRAAAEAGIAAWSQRMPSPIGTVVVGENMADAQIVLDFRPVGDGTDLGVANYQPPRILKHVDIHIYLLSTQHNAGPQTWLVDVIQGRKSLTAWQNDVASVVAHEMGHALGIGEHSASRNDLMYPDVQLPGIAPALRISEADRNTMMHSYCQR